MEKKSLEIKAAIQILKPPHEVFEAIADPFQMSNYFISSSTGIMEEGKELVWRFPEFDMDCPIQVGKIEKSKYLSYSWKIEGKAHLVEIGLEPYGQNATVVTVTEKGGENTQKGIEWLKGNTEGWANFLACLKAYLEYGINLRKGAFEFRKS